ncbi:amidohydrolase family protein [Microbacterium sp. SSW1-49]|uniref:Amidohydrolase family protein n=1 Tax=Microbacterium croceum TaxID=2851645 RepID=A0ABT0FG77_9MICO|nr:amidohydrolase family protein [Microbacterium croceum]MCK2037053.1 amidohydrolase family protein [Microbacterium croceum]
MLPERSDLLLRNAHILSLEADVPEGRGDVLIRDGVLAAIGQGLTAPAGVEVIDATGHIAMPGFIDTHWHLWNSLLRGTVGDAPGRDYFSVKRGIAPHFDLDDFYWSARFALAEAVQNGITTVHNWDHNVRDAGDVDANLQAQIDSGLRGRFSYGPRDSSAATEMMDFEGLDAARARWSAARLDHRIHFGVALRGPYRTSTDLSQREWRGARERGMPITMHCDRCLRENGCTSCGLTRLDREGLLGPDVQVVHAIHASPADVEAVARTGTKISVSPLSEMRTMGFPQVTEFLEAGALTSLSVDTLAMPANADVLSTLRALLSAEHARSGRATLTPRIALEMATIRAARDLGIEDLTGSLLPGKRADLLLLDASHSSLLPSGDLVESLIYNGTSSAIRTAICDGRVLMRSGALVQDSARHAISSANERRDALVRRARDAGTWTDN